MEQAAESLRTFSVDILANLHAVTTKPTVATQQELDDVGSKLDPTISFHRSNVFH